MTATNHALTGAVIGLVVGEPLIAIPAALASHFVCDALPHYTSSRPVEQILRSRSFRNYLLVEMCLCASLVGVLAVFQPQHWLLAAFCAFVAAAPDLFSINRYLKTRRRQIWRPSLYSRFAEAIQWFARPVGAAVEVAWFAAAIIILVPFFR